MCQALSTSSSLSTHLPFLPPLANSSTQWGKHENLLQLMGWTASSDLTGMILEWCPNGTLSDILSNQQQLSWADPLLKLATDAARGLGFLHSKGLGE